MKKEIRTVVYDDELRIEAYRFEGIVQPFPNHFHEYYVIGFVEEGERCLSCKNQEYVIKKGDIVLFNPGDNHSCVQRDEGTLDYRGFNITKEVMLDLAEEVTGKRELPGFFKNVIYDGEVTCYLCPLHELVMKGSCEFGKEENLLLFLSILIQQYGQPFENCIPSAQKRLKKPAPLWNSTMRSASTWIKFVAARASVNRPFFGHLQNSKGLRHIAIWRTPVSAKQRSSWSKVCRLSKRHCKPAFLTRAILQTISTDLSGWPLVSIGRSF